MKTAKEELEAAMVEMDPRAAAAHERLEWVRLRPEEIGRTIAARAAVGESTADLEAELVALPAQLLAAEAAVRGIEDRRADISAQIREINLDERRQRVTTRNGELVAAAARSMADGEARLRAIGEWIVAHDRIVLEVAELRRSAQDVGVGLEAVAPASHVLSNLHDKLRREFGRRVESREVMVPYLAP